ncbi:MAG: DUF2927 domain-containing protein [Alphaproteobacteria bacterium]
MRRRFIFVLVALLWPTVGHTASYDEIVRQFDAIAFSDEGGNYADSFRRWPSGRHIRIRIDGGGEPSALLLGVLDELTALSGIRMTVAEPANVVVSYVPRGCSGQTNNFRGTVRISTNSLRATRRCTHEELAQLIGPANDACHYRPSIYCGRDVIERFTDADKIILRTTFDPRLRSGMTRAEGMPIARQLIRELYEEAYGPIDKTRRPDDEAQEPLSLP